MKYYLIRISNRSYLYGIFDIRNYFIDFYHPKRNKIWYPVGWNK